MDTYYKLLKLEEKSRMKRSKLWITFDREDWEEFKNNILKDQE